MSLYIVIAVFMAVPRVANTNNGILSSFKEFCRAVLKTLPRPEEDGKVSGRVAFTNAVQDQQEAGTDEIIISTLPSRDFLIRKIQVDNKGLPRLRTPIVKRPKIKVPKLEESLQSPEFLPATVVDERPYAKFKDRMLKDEASQTERMENFKKGLQKMLHIVKVLGEIDHYLSDRTRIVIDKILKVLSK
ncbi:hypothetical protein EVAR_35881_1 [Eumeta japonica]|uniref:Uncharacterized protein n=1 Tax=Eumeta variegata TaxID=151549 RepID=A0A4C1WWS2_EUMVA|nr:hypothetical protein EVAR_35881_1 [Eumeta japonica]